MAREDLRHMLKHKRTYLPTRVTPTERRILARRSWLARAWMGSGKKLYIFVARRILNWEDNEARGMAQGRDRTDAALKAFYKDVLPPNFAQARGASYLRLSQLAEQHNLEWSGRQGDRESEKDASLARMRMSMSLRGDYDDIRRFIYQVESGTDFIVIDSIALRQSTEPGASLTFDLSLSTYYHVGPDGA